MNIPIKPLHPEFNQSIGGGTLMGESEYLPLDPNQRHSTNGPIFMNQQPI